MNKKKVAAIILAMLAILALAGFWIFMLTRPVDKKSVSYNGWLRTEGARVLNQRGEEVQLVGISTHGIQWFGELYNADSIRELKEGLGINVFRIAMYVNPDDNGYIANRGLKDKVIELVDAAIELDIYAIIDWHVLNEKDPLTYKTEALEFFGEMAEKYADKPNVLYEIANEPNGKEIDWDGHIRPYAEEVIGRIREKAPKSFVIVGTPDWSKGLNNVRRNPLQLENVAYALHFYAGSHNDLLRDKMDTFRENNLALFVSECGATDTTGDGKIYDEDFETWINYLNEHKISWVLWAFANKDEASSIVTDEYKSGVVTEENSLDKYLTETGKLFKRLTTPGV